MDQPTRKIILLIDDDRRIRRFMVSALWDEDVILIEAENLSKARTILALQSFDLIITDYELPDGDGLSFIAEVRAIIPDQQFILCSGNPPEPDEIPANVLLLNKPIRVEELITAVSRYSSRP